MTHNSQPHEHSLRFRTFRSKRKYSGVFILSAIFFDTAIIILGFYIANSPIILQPGINIQLPKTTFTGGSILDGSTLSIGHDGSFFYQSERISSDRLKEYLLEKVRINPDMTLIIEADERAHHGALVEAWTIARLSGVQQISIATGLKAQNKE